MAASLRSAGERGANRMAHLRIWKFRPPAGREQEFAGAYGSGGDWAQLFGRASGYLGTRLLKPSGSDDWWLTIDRWASEGDFDAFQQSFGEDYRALDSQLEGVAGQEEFVGAFED
jgi:heme-degrading monooxygenase HmoA